MSSNRTARRSRRSANNFSRRARYSSRVQGTSVAPDAPFRVQGRALSQVYTINNASSTYSTTTPTVFNSPNLFSDATKNMITSMQEWRILRVVAKICPLSDMAGSTAFGFTMDSTTGTPSTWQTTARVRILPNTNQGTHTSYSMVWNAKSYDDISFQSTSSLIAQPVAFYAYTDAANYGTPAATANVPVFRVDYDVLLGLRGLGNT